MVSSDCVPKITKSSYTSMTPTLAGMEPIAGDLTKAELNRIDASARAHTVGESGPYASSTVA